MMTEEVSDTSNGGISNVALASVLKKDLLSYVRFEHKSILLISEGASAIVRIQTTQIWSRSSNQKTPPPSLQAPFNILRIPFSRRSHCSLNSIRKLKRLSTNLLIST
jgi:hypothetical protein